MLKTISVAARSIIASAPISSTPPSAAIRFQNPNAVAPAAMSNPSRRHTIRKAIDGMLYCGAEEAIKPFYVLYSGVSKSAEIARQAFGMPAPPTVPRIPKRTRAGGYKWHALSANTHKTHSTFSFQVGQ